MQAVIFDMDGVLVDSEPLYEQSLHVFLVRNGIKQPDVPSLNLKGVSARDTSVLLIEKFNLEYEIEELMEVARNAYLEHLNSLDDLPAIPGAVELVKYLAKSGYPLAVASSASAHRINLFLTKLKLKQHFQVTVCGDDVQKSKPAPDIFLLAAARLGANPKDCVVVEDANNGVLAAKAAGMKCIAYAGSVHNVDDLSAADVIVKDFVTLTKSLKTNSLPV